MKFPFINDPETGKPSEMITLSVIVTLSAASRFLLDGVTLNIDHHVFTFGHIDSMTYLAFLSPIVGAHGYIKGRLMGDDKNDSTK